MSSSTFDEHSLSVFYSRLFPYDLMHEWLSYGTASAGGQNNNSNNNNNDVSKDLFFRREFSFTKANDVYIRYLSFRDAAEFKERVKKDIPHKIDIGAVYSFPAKDHASVAQTKFRPLLRELVFDIDLDDYSEVQTTNPPGESKSIWARGSWLFMACAIKVLDACLREDFGFEHILFVFSGRRGVHCWVSDEAALKLEDDERSAIVDYLTVVVGGTQKSATNTGDVDLSQRIKLTSPRHPSIRRAVEICKPMFKQAFIDDVKGQGILATEERWTRILGMIPNVDGVRDRLADKWRETVSTYTSEKRWDQLEATVREEARKTKNKKDEDSLLKALDSIVLFHIYPKLDVNVSKHRNHLLKSPFVIHPKTGNVCVPIFNVDRCEQFDPDAVPNLKTLMLEIEEAKEKTSLHPILEKFEVQFLIPMRRQYRAKSRDKQEKEAAITGQW